MVVMTEQLRAKPGREAELAEHLGSLAKEARSEAGCREYRIARSQHDSQVVLVIASFTDSAALADHTREEHYTEALEPLMDCLEGPPTVALFDEFGAVAQGE